MNIQIDNLNYASYNTILFQRLSVEVTDLLLIGSLLYFFHFRAAPRSSLVSFICCIFAPGFLIVDHIHFQYNGYLIGLYILSIVLLTKVVAVSFCNSESSSSRSVCLLIRNELQTSFLFPSTHFSYFSSADILHKQKGQKSLRISSFLLTRRYCGFQ